MRTVPFDALNRHVSVIGFGCASLGSRVSEKTGLAALKYAYDSGINWYDVAPSYGDGSAESILGSFLNRRRSDVVICTKVGIQPPTLSRVARLVRPAVRRLIEVAPTLRSRIVKIRPPVQRTLLSAVSIRRSIEQSLQRLKTDYVDVLALHDPSTVDCQNDEILRELQQILERGLARAISIAGPETAIIVGSRKSPLFRIAQFENNPCNNTYHTLRSEPATATLSFVTHSTFAPAAIDQLLPQLTNRRPPLGRQEAHELLLDYALARNSSGVTLLSMFDKRHIELNCQRASRQINALIVEKLENMLGPQ